MLQWLIRTKIWHTTWSKLIASLFGSTWVLDIKYCCSNRPGPSLDPMTLKMCRIPSCILVPWNQVAPWRLLASTYSLKLIFLVHRIITSNRPRRVSNCFFFFSFFQILVSSLGGTEASKRRICRGADRRRKSHGLLLPEGSILLTYSVPMRPLTHSSNTPHTHTKPTYFIFHFQQFSVALQQYWYKKTVGSWARAGMEGTQPYCTGEISVQPKRNITRSFYHGNILKKREAQWQTCRLNVCSSVAAVRDRFQPGGFDFM